jgi:hypothetical protein
MRWAYLIQCCIARVQDQVMSIWTLLCLLYIQLAGDEPSVNASNFLAELKRRNVYKVAVAYAVAGWALSQGIAQIFPVFKIRIGCQRDCADNRGGIPDGARNV